MKNMNITLNPGGVIGALACGGIAGAIVFSTLDPTNSGNGPYAGIIFALVAGAFAGNFLWGSIFSK